MSVLKRDLTKAVFGLSGNKIHDNIIDLVHDMHEGRAYHNLGHVAYAVNEMYYHFDECVLSNVDKCRLVIALYFHDIHQDLMNPIEAISHSAALMEESLCDVLKDFDIAAIKRLILSTGAMTPATEAEFLIHDADYSILGNESWNEYHAYAKDVEKEALAQDISFKKYDEGRISFLTDLLVKPNTIFFTSYFGKNYEWQARKNILREIELRRSGEF